jgi:hypothetical protein
MWLVPRLPGALGRVGPTCLRLLGASEKKEAPGNYLRDPVLCDL